MKKLIGIYLLFVIINSTFAQSNSYLKEYDNIYKSLERKNFHNVDFSDSVKMFVFFNNNIIYNEKSPNEVIVTDLNTIILHVGYNRFTISQAASPMDRGFIINLYNDNSVCSVYMVVDENNRVNVILIRKS